MELEFADHAQMALEQIQKELLAYVTIKDRYLIWESRFVLLFLTLAYQMMTTLILAVFQDIRKMVWNANIAVHPVLFLTYLEFVLVQMVYILKEMFAKSQSLAQLNQLGTLLLCLANVTIACKIWFKANARYVKKTVFILQLPNNVYAALDFT